MIDYLEKLQKLGYSMLTARRIYEFFIQNFGRDILDYVIEKLEREKDVEEVQS